MVVDLPIDALRELAVEAAQTLDSLFGLNPLEPQYVRSSVCQEGLCGLGPFTNAVATTAWELN